MCRRAVQPPGCPRRESRGWVALELPGEVGIFRPFARWGTFSGFLSLPAPPLVASTRSDRVPVRSRPGPGPGPVPALVPKENLGGRAPYEIQVRGSGRQGKAPPRTKTNWNLFWKKKDQGQTTSNEPFGSAGPVFCLDFVWVSRGLLFVLACV